MSYRHFKKSLKPFVSNCIGPLCRAAGRFILKKYLVVFIYHDVSSNPSEFSSKFSLNVYPDIFEYQMRFINDNFKIISPDDLLSKELPPRAALITFDDGFRSYFKQAVAIMESYNTPSIIFLNMAPIRGEAFWSGVITYLCQKHSDFKDFIEERTSGKLSDDRPLYLYCSRDIVKAYFNKKGQLPYEKISEFVGQFADENDLEKACLNPLVFYGNHFFNHDVLSLLSDEELRGSFLKNEELLKNYPNYRPMVSLTFGQPETCYRESQVKLLLENNVKKVFSSSGKINFNNKSSHLDRIALSSFDDSSSKIWFQIFQETLKGPR